MPALNFEALWIGSDDPQCEDVLIALHQVGRLALYQPIALTAAYALLREAAHPRANMDDLKGARGRRLIWIKPAALAC